MSKKIADKGATEAFLRAHVNHDGKECLLWPYAKTERGYGWAAIGGVQKTASRWMCILAHGEPPSRFHEAAHSCGTPSCVNPNHLRWDTPKGNQADRNVHGTHNRGERNGKTALTAEDVRAIRAAPPDLKPLMERYGLSKHGVSKIRSGKRWGHITSLPGALPALPMPLPGNPEAGSTPGTAAPASDEFMLTCGLYHPLERE